MEKKVDIVQYAQQTRQLYVRLLALVKWAASASKVDKCCVSMRFSVDPVYLLLLVPKPWECMYQVMYIFCIIIVNFYHHHC